MRILHVVAGLPQEGGGIAEIVPRLAAETARLGHHATIATVAAKDARLSRAAEEARASGVAIETFRPSPPRVVHCSVGLWRGMRGLAASSDLVHVHSDWTFPVWCGCRFALDEGKPLVMSPHGCLSPTSLAHSPWKKRLAGVLDRRCLRRASVIHAASDAERDWIARYVGGSPRIVVVPNGVDLPPARRADPPADRVRRALFLGRLHPLKGLDLLIKAWAAAGSRHPPGQPWQLVIAGPDERGTRAALEREVGRLGLETVVFAGPIYGEQKARAIGEADLLVLPSRSENFGIVVAEALAAGVPVITTKAAPWGEIDGVCGWWVDIGAGAIAEAVAAAMRLDDGERAAMGGRGRRLVEERYQWPAVGRAMEELYRQARLRGEERQP